MRPRPIRPVGEAAGTGPAAEIGGQDVMCEEQDIDLYRRVVGICHAGPRVLSAWMVESGWAVACMRYGGDLDDAEEMVARVARRGIWSGNFVMPWHWRSEEREVSASARSRSDLQEQRQ